MVVALSFRVDTNTISGDDCVMNIDIYDTYVRTAEHHLLHFYVLLPSGEGRKATLYAREWLCSIGKTAEEISLEICRYYHSEITSPEIQQHISAHRYFIIQMEGCPVLAV